MPTMEITNVRKGIALGTWIALAACASSPAVPGPVDSGSIALTINMNNSDVAGGVVQKDKNISTEQGNPWGEFVKKAKATCGKDPQGFEVTSLSVSVDASKGGSKTVKTFEEVVSGNATVSFRSNGASDPSAAAVDIGTVASPKGAGPVVVPVSATRQSLAAIQARLVGGDMHVAFRGQTAKSDKDDFDLDVRVTLSARALCE